MRPDRARIASVRAREEERFVNARPKSQQLFERARASLLGGVPMNWMTKWPGGFPPFIVDGAGSTLTDADGHTYADLCLGDTGAMASHSPPAAITAVEAQLAHGVTFMLPTEAAVDVGEELGRRFAVA